jgi:tetratricopeptide (TPR) repeat protein
VVRPRPPAPVKDQPRPTSIRWQDLGPVGTRATRSPREQKSVTRRSNLLPVIEAEYGGRIRTLVGTQRAPRLTRRLAEAAGHFEEGRYLDAERMLVELLRDLGDLRVAVEMLALSRYRLGRWLKAADALERARILGAGFINHPVLADCYRALGRHDRVEVLWRELSEASPRPDIVAEGRIVMASSLADRGDLAGAIRLMRPRMRQPRVVDERHLREWYVLADLLDRSGETGSARRLFERILGFDREFSDVRVRLAVLGAM